MYFFSLNKIWCTSEYIVVSFSVGINYEFVLFVVEPALEPHVRSAGAESSSQKPIGFAPSAKVQEIRKRLLSFMEQHIYPSEKELNELMYSSTDRWTIHPTEERLKKMAKAEGLWNLWIPVLQRTRCIVYALLLM